MRIWQRNAKGIADDKTLTEDAKKDKMKDLGKTMRGDFEKILTPEQTKKMGELRKERRSKLAKGVGRPDNTGTTERTGSQKAVVSDLIG